MGLAFAYSRRMIARTPSGVGEIGMRRTWKRATDIATTTMATAVLLAAAVAQPAPAQVRDNGVLVQRGFLGQKLLPNEFQIIHASEFKGAHRVAIAVFNVAFPSHNHFTAKTSGTHSGMFGMSSRAASTMDTTLSGVDRATQQRIADRAYAAFVAQLTAAGYDVVDQNELHRLAPELATWTPEPGDQGRFGTYVAPTGMAIHFLPGDRQKRDSSGMFGQQALMIGTGLDKSQAFGRSPYLARDANIGIIAVNLVVDYGVYSSSGERMHAFGGGASTGFLPGVALAAGNAVDRGTVVHYWGPKSGGFPAYAFLQVPVRSDRDFRGSGSSDFNIVADPARFEAAANDAIDQGVPKLAAVMAQGR